MQYLSTILILVAGAPHLITSVNDYLFGKANDFAGRSWIFDNLTALATENNLIKAALVGACFLMVWMCCDSIRKGKGDTVKKS